MTKSAFAYFSKSVVCGLTQFPVLGPSQDIAPRKKQTKHQSVQPVFITVFFNVCLKKQFDGLYGQIIFNFFRFGPSEFPEHLTGFAISISIVLIYELRNGIKGVMFYEKIGIFHFAGYLYQMVHLTLKVGLILSE